MSTFLHDEIQQPDTPVEVWFGIIARNVTNLNERAYVLLPEFSQDNQVGPCFWQSRDDTSLPARGDRCVVVADNRGQFWIIAWWPYTT